MQKKLLAGKKIGGRHTSLINESIPLVMAAKESDEVSKIVISVIVPMRVGPRRMKFTIIPAGLKLQVRGVNSKQTLFVYTKDPKDVEEFLLGVWRKVLQ